MLYPWITTIAIFAVMMYSTITDIRRHELPIEWFLLVLFPMGVIIQILQIGEPLSEVVISAFIMGGTYFIVAYFFGGGGGDVIMMTTLAVCLGGGIFIIAAVSIILLFLYRLKEKIQGKTVKEVPYAPFVTLGLMLERIIFFCK